MKEIYFFLFIFFMSALAGYKHLKVALNGQSTVIFSKRRKISSIWTDPCVTRFRLVVAQRLNPSPSRLHRWARDRQASHQEYPRRTGPASYGHTTVKAPHPIRTAKLSTVGFGQYCHRGLGGNSECCMAWPRPTVFPILFYTMLYFSLFF